MMVFKIALIAIGGSILAIVVEQFQKEYSVFVLLAVCLFLLACLTANVSAIVDFAENLGEKIQISDTYMKILFKLLAIAYISQTASGICQDLGYQSIAFQVELLGKLSIFTLSIPIINALLETIEAVL